MKTTLQSLAKIPTVPCLYRHENGSYYGKKKIRGTKKVAALVTADGSNITDRKTAEKALAGWIAKLENPAPADAGMSLASLFEKFEGMNAGKSQSTLDRIAWVKQCVEVGRPALLKMAIYAIKPSDLAELYAARSKDLSPVSFNDMTEKLKAIFEVAVDDAILTVNPCDKVTKNLRRKKVVRTPDEVPTIEQCEAIVSHVRGQEFADTADKSADMLALMHGGALGTAECVLADWKKVKWEAGIIEVRRQKTGAFFSVPIFPHLEPFLVDLWERQGKPGAGRLISILSPKQALYNACKRLGLPAYSPRDLRKARIVWMLRKGVPVETIAKWQGHKDNGVLIRRTYAWITSEADKAFEDVQLAKLQ